MKIIKRLSLTLLIMILVILPIMAVSAAEDDNTVVFDGSKLSNTSAGNKVISGMLPGSEATYKVAFINKSNTETDWYVANKVLESFEDAGKASGGAYTYILTYIDPEGRQTVLFSNENVGGDTGSEVPKGLHQASDAMEDYFYLDTVAPGKGGSIELYIAMDGESQANSYMNAVAELNIEFAVEAESSSETTTPAQTTKPSESTKPAETTKKSSNPKTSDDLNPELYIIVFTVAAIAISLAIYRRKKDEAEK